MNKQILTKSVLRQLISEEVEKQIHMEKKQIQMNENPLQFISDNPEAIAGIGTLATILGPLAFETFKAIVKSPKDAKSIVKNAVEAAQKSAGKSVKGIEKATGADTMGQGLGGFKP
jgi:hypothetical protein